MSKKIRPFLALVTAVLLLSGCGREGDETKIVDAPVELTPTQELSLCVPAGYSFFADAMARLYNQFYPEVRLEVRVLEDDSYETQVSAEIMAHSGGDLIFATPYYFQDLYKTMDSGAFLNLNEILAGDGEFRLEDYVQGVMDSGVHRGGRYLVPLNYIAPVLLSGDALLEKYGVDFDALTDFGGLSGQLRALAPSVKQNPQALFPLVNAYYANRFTGVSVIDRETGAVLPDEAGVRVLMDWSGLLWGELEDATMRTGPLDDAQFRQAARQGKFALSLEVYPYNYIADYLYFSSQDAVRMRPLCGVDGKFRGEAQMLFAVNANSKNQLNAWNFLKLMLSEHYQSIMDAFPFGTSLPVRKASQKELYGPALEGWQRGLCREDSSLTPVPISVLNDYLELTQTVEAGELYVPAVWELGPSGAGNPDEDVEQFRRRLEVYVSE